MSEDGNIIQDCEKGKSVPTWLIIRPMNIPPGADHVEMWVSKDPPAHQERSYEVNVRLGKPIDILSLKLNMIEGFDSQVSHVSSTRTSLFESAEMEEVDKCPICGSSTQNSEFRLNIYGGLYHQCSVCSHFFVVKRPTKVALEQFYSSNVHYASTYTDKRITETRVRQVAIPKAEWMVEQFEKLYGRKPKSILDVGAGGGHFVYACRQLGIEAQGIELSEVSREFCRTNFGFDLGAIDFTKEWGAFSDVDVVTFWGVIEHVPNPMSLLNTAYQLLCGRKTLVIAEVPRWNCLSTAIQGLFPSSVVRHLDPLGHTNCFTDSSLATAFETSGFAPVAAWYFGMDAYELTTQLAYLLRKSPVISILGKHIPFLQSAIDQARLCDEIVLAAKPFGTENGV